MRSLHWSSKCKCPHPHQHNPLKPTAKVENMGYLKNPTRWVFLDFLGVEPRFFCKEAQLDGFQGFQLLELALLGTSSTSTRYPQTCKFIAFKCIKSLTAIKHFTGGLPNKTCEVFLDMCACVVTLKLAHTEWDEETWLSDLSLMSDWTDTGTFYWTRAMADRSWLSDLSLMLVM